MRRNRRIVVAVCGSILVHVVICWRIALPPPSRPAAVRLAVTLVPAAARDPLPQPEAVPVEERTQQPPARPPETVAVATGGGEQPSPEVPSEVMPEGQVALNLERPENWDALVGGSEQPPPEPGGVALRFNPRLEELLEARLQAKERALLVAEREAARYGVADEDYTRSGVLGSEIKRDGRCFTLVEAAGVEPGARWWAGTCPSARQRPLFQSPPGYDGLGRAVVD
jgi:hypothetical protein